jgi:hypothetical protein
MPSRNVLINGVTYVKSGEAARVMDLAPDYVSHLARHGATVGERVGGIWIIDLVLPPTSDLSVLRSS